MQMGGCLLCWLLQRFFYIDTFQIVISIYKRIVRIFFRKIYGREINGINQGSYLKQHVMVCFNVGISRILPLLINHRFHCIKCISTEAHWCPNGGRQITHVCGGRQIIQGLYLCCGRQINVYYVAAAR